jgi:hypothetical protein
VGGTFQYNVGKEANGFILHSKLVSQHSPIFHALMYGHIKEAQENRTGPNHVDGNKFARFAEFIYGGDYHAAEALAVLYDVETEKPRAERSSPGAEEDFPTDPSPRIGAFSPPGDAVIDWSIPHKYKKKRNRVKVPIRNQPSPLADLSLPSIDKVFSPRSMTPKRRVVPD